MGYSLQKEDAMRLATPGKILFFVLLFLPVEQIFSQSASQATESPNFVSAEVSVHEFQRHQLSWFSEHPELATQVTKGRVPGDTSVTLFKTTYPTLDIYSSAGVSFYFSDSSDVNVKVIDALPRVIPEPDLDPRYKARPSLREARSMIPGIPRSDWATPAQIDYTVFAVILNHTGDTPAQSKDASASHAKNKAIYQQSMNGGPSIRATVAPVSPEDAQRNALANQAQDEAIQRLKTRLNGSRVRVIEIRVTEP
jgi:hypothetical protein